MVFQSYDAHQAHLLGLFLPQNDAPTIRTVHTYLPSGLMVVVNMAVDSVASVFGRSYGPQPLGMPRLLYLTLCSIEKKKRDNSSCASPRRHSTICVRRCHAMQQES